MGCCCGFAAINSERDAGTPSNRRMFCQREFSNQSGEFIDHTAGIFQSQCYRRMDFKPSPKCRHQASKGETNVTKPLNRFRLPVPSIMFNRAPQASALRDVRIHLSDVEGPRVKFPAGLPRNSQSNFNLLKHSSAWDSTPISQQRFRFRVQWKQATETEAATCCLQIFKG